MNEDRVPIGDAVSFGWNAMKNNLGYFILVVLILMVIGGIPGGLQSLTSYMNTTAAVIFGVIFGVISILVGAFVNMAQTRIGLRATAGEAVEYEDIYSSYPRYGDFLIASILYGLLVLAGFILLIVPGIYWAIKYHFYGYLILDQNMKPVEAFKKSGEITYGAKWSLLLFFLACIGIYILGFICCCVGIFAAIPVILVAIAYVYRTLLGTASGQAMPETPPLPPQQPAPPAQ